jgi:hypothetical protein
MSKIGRPSNLQRKKSARLKWSRNANAAKARKRMECGIVGPDPKMNHFFPWEITVRYLLTRENATFRPRSGRHAKAALDVLFAEYR